MGLHVFLIGKIIGFIPAAGPSRIHEIFRQPAVAFLSGIFIKAVQGQFNLLMAGRIKGCGMLLPEHTVNQRHVFFHNFKQFSLSGRLRIGDGGFRQMSCAVQLMIRPALKPFFRLHGCKVAVQVTVLPLMLLHPVNQLVHPRFQFFIPLLQQKICRSLDPFCHIGIPENMRPVRHSLLPCAV